MTTEIIIPEMGEGVIEGTLARWLVKEGDVVAQYDPIAEIETDKVTTELTAEVGGTVLKLLADEGSTLPVETVVALIGAPGESVPTNGSAPAAEPVPAPAVAPAAAPAAQGGLANGRSATADDRSPRISPLVGRIAAEHHVDLSRVSGTGRNGRVTKDDILAYIEQARQPAGIPDAPPVPQPAPAPTPAPAPAPVAASPGTEIVPLNSMRRAIAEHMVLSKHTSPHVTTVFEFDFTAVATHRAAHKEAFARDGARLTYTVYIVAAVVQALKQHPLVNSSWSDDGIVLKREINLGLAAAVAEGLVVPVIHHADSYNLLGLARAINDLTGRARTKKLTHADLQGGTFSLTNHGTSGSLFATPIINQPQCGILGIGKIEKRVKVIDDAIAIRPLAYASFTFDHRILDGASADAFVSTVKEILESWR